MANYQLVRDYKSVYSVSPSPPQSAPLEGPRVTRKSGKLQKTPCVGRRLSKHDIWRQAQTSAALLDDDGRIKTADRWSATRTAKMSPLSNMVNATGVLMRAGSSLVNGGKRSTSAKRTRRSSKTRMLSITHKKKENAPKEGFEESGKEQWLAPLARAELDARAASEAASRQNEDATAAAAKREALAKDAASKKKKAIEAKAQEAAGKAEAATVKAEAAKREAEAEALRRVAEMNALVARRTANQAAAVRARAATLGTIRPESAQREWVEKREASMKSPETWVRPDSSPRVARRATGAAAPYAASAPTDSPVVSEKEAAKVEKEAKKRAAREEAAAARAADAVAAARKAVEDATASEKSKAAAATAAAEMADRAAMAEAEAAAEAEAEAAAARSAEAAAEARAEEEEEERRQAEEDALSLVQEKAQMEQQLSDEAAATEAADAAASRKQKKAAQQLKGARPSILYPADPIKLQAAIDAAIEAGVEAADVKQAQAELNKVLQERLASREARRAARVRASDRQQARLLAAQAPEPVWPLAGSLFDLISSLGETAARCVSIEPLDGPAKFAAGARMIKMPASSVPETEHAQAEPATESDKASTAVVPKPEVLGEAADGCVAPIVAWAAAVTTLLCGQQRIGA